VHGVGSLASWDWTFGELFAMQLNENLPLPLFFKEGIPIYFGKGKATIVGWVEAPRADTRRRKRWVSPALHASYV